MKAAFLVTNYNEHDAIAIYTKELRRKFDVSDVFAEQSASPAGTGIRTQYLRRLNWTLGTYLLEWKFGISAGWLNKLLVSARNRGYNRAVEELAQYDIVWLHWSMFSEFGEVFRRLAKLSRRPVLVFDYHGITPVKYADTRGKKFIMQKGFDFCGSPADAADICITHSEYTRAELAQNSSVRNTEIVYFFCPENPPVGDLPKALRGKTKNRKILLSFGRIARHKNLETVIRTVAQLRNPSLLYVIAGNDSRPSLRREKERLLQIAVDLGVEKQVIFTGEVSDAQKWRLYKEAYVYILASWHEGFGWPLIEVMSIPRPIIASRSGSIPEVVGAAALLFNPNSVSELVANLNSLIADPKIYEQYQQKSGQRSRAFTRSRFSKRIDQLIDLIKKTESKIN